MKNIKRLRMDARRKKREASYIEVCVEETGLTFRVPYYDVPGWEKEFARLGIAATFTDLRDQTSIN